MKTIKKGRKIVGWSIPGHSDSNTVAQAIPAITPRPVSLQGETFKVKSHHYHHSFYVTINSMDGKPFEIFINTANEDSSMWTTALTRSWSAVMRAEDDIDFLINEMLQIVDPKGGHFAHQKNHKSVIAEIGYILQQYKNNKPLGKPLQTASEAPQAPQGTFEGQEDCPECSGTTWKRLDGCDQCVACEWSKCG